jgi:uncharacterized membrane protein
MPGTDGERGIVSSITGISSAIYNHFWSVFLTGIAIIVPVIITLYLARVAVNFIRDGLAVFVFIFEYFNIIQQFQSVGLVAFLMELNVYSLVIGFVTELIALVLLLTLIMIIGAVGHNRYGERIIEFVDFAIASIPGVGTVYKSFRRMGDVMLDSEAENFQDIKLVRALGGEMYVLGFETSTAPVSVEDSADHDEMATLFIPMAPNPVTGGFLTYVPREDVYDIDMTIEDGVRSILTSGVATGKNAADDGQLSLESIQNVAGVEQLQDAFSINREDDDGN